MEIPQNYQTVMPYLILKNASGFIEFMQQVFHAELTNKTMRDENCIMHGEVMVGKSTIMFADSNDQYPPRPAGLFIYVDHADEAYQRAISKGAKVVTEIASQTYGRSGGVLDPFGNTWWITSVS